jgi:uncharacterized membrane protein HdeD (DUF308 family)
MNAEWSAAVVFRILAFILPGAAVTVLVVLFGAYALWDDVFAAIGPFRSQGAGAGPWY